MCLYFSLVLFNLFQTGQLYPPTVLLEFHPLAAYCNDILTALNELRLCAPVAMVTEVCNAVHDSFVNVNKVILAFHRYSWFKILVESMIGFREMGK